MKKKVLAVILLTVGASLAACGQKETPPPATEAATTAAQETTMAAATEAAPKTEVKTGQGEGYGGPITAEVTLDGDKIVDLKYVKKAYAVYKKETIEKKLDRKVELHIIKNAKHGFSKKCDRVAAGYIEQFCNLH